MRHMFDAQNEVGRLADERIYANDIVNRVQDYGTICFREVKVELIHDQFQKDLFLDLVVDHCGIYELKTVSTLTPRHRAQLMTYLYLLNVEHGKLVNFRSTTVQSEFVNATVPRSERCGFNVDARRFDGDDLFVRKVVAMSRDWGSCLSVSLYRECTGALCGSCESASQHLPLQRNRHLLGNQRFWLLNQKEAFEFTSFTGPDDEFKDQLQRLVNLSQLAAIHHVNVGTHLVTFSTIRRCG